MKSRTIMASLAGLALLTTPIMAQAAEPVRAGAPVANAEGMGEDSGMLAMFGFIAALVALVVIASDDGGSSNSSPVSV